MTNWYWYAARENELMVDLDSQTLLEIALKRLKKGDFSAVQCVPVQKIFVAPSNSEDHFHLVIKLTSNMPEMWRMVAQLWLMDHCYRSVRNMERVLAGKRSPCLLISPHNWTRSAVALNSGVFWRNPDAVCQCPVQRHKSAVKIWECPAHFSLRGEQ